MLKDAAQVHLSGIPRGDGGRFAPDGKWVAYVSAESGTEELYVASYPNPAVKYRISPTVGLFPRWRGDGGELFFWGPQSTIYAVPFVKVGDTLRPGAPHALFSVAMSSGLYPSFDVDASGMKFVVNTNLAGTPSDLVLITNWAR